MTLPLPFAVTHALQTCPYIRIQTFNAFHDALKHKNRIKILSGMLWYPGRIQVLTRVAAAPTVSDGYPVRSDVVLGRSLSNWASLLAEDIGCVDILTDASLVFHIPNCIAPSSLLTLGRPNP